MFLNYLKYKSISISSLKAQRGIAKTKVIKTLAKSNAKTVKVSKYV